VVGRAAAVYLFSVLVFPVFYLIKLCLDKGLGILLWLRKVIPGLLKVLKSIKKDWG